MARMDDERVSLTDHAVHHMRAALRARGADVLSADPLADSDESEVVGTRFFRLIFADRTGQHDFDEQLAALARDPDGEAAQDTLEGLISDALEDEPEVAAAVFATMADFYRRRANAGSVQAMADLGNLLYWENDRDGAEAAYQQAIDAGRHETLIDMAHLLRFTDNDAARACLDQAMAVGDPDLTALALVTLSTVLAGSGPERSDPAGAESALLQAIETGHPDFAPEAMSLLGSLRERHGDAEGARAAYQQAIDTGHAEWADRSRSELAYMLKEQGDLAGAREQYERLVESGNEHWAPHAVEDLAILLQDDGDVDGLRALHQNAAQAGNWSAPEVLVTLGFLLEQRGDADGARAALQQAIDDGYHGADWLIEKLHPSPKPTAAELDALPPPFDPRNMVRTGIEVLSHGLPELPEQLRYLMAIPVAYWTAPHSAVVLFLRFQREGRQYLPGVVHVTYLRDGDGWIANRHFIGMGYSHDPIANPGGLRDLGGSAMVTGGGSETQPHGRAAPAVKYVALIQDGQEDLRPLDSHFGAWVVSTEQRTSFDVEGRDADGNVLARISFDPDDYR
jgi:tetratricopeptide (TPR) repeat protein